LNDIKDNYIKLAEAVVRANSSTQIRWHIDKVRSILEN